MATWDDVRDLVFALPEVTEAATRDGSARWRVRDKLFAWERPLRRADLEALGRDEQGGPVLAAHVADLGVRAALIADQPGAFFTTPHFADYPAVLAWLDELTRADVEELLIDAWLQRAPARLVKAFLAVRRQ